MKLGLQITLAILSLIPAYYGPYNAIAGAARFMDPTAVTAGLDNQFRFESGYYISLALLAWWMIPRIEREPTVFRILMAAIFCGGLGRVYSYMQYGSAGPVATGAMVLELALPLLILWQNAVIKQSKRAHAPG